MFKYILYLFYFVSFSICYNSCFAQSIFSELDAVNVITGKHTEANNKSFTRPELFILNGSHSFLYEDDRTEVYDPDGRKIVFCFSNDKMTSIENYNSDGILQGSQAFFYDPQKNLIDVITHGSLPDYTKERHLASSDEILIKQITHQDDDSRTIQQDLFDSQGKYLYSTYTEYDEKFRPIAISNSLGSLIKKNYDEDDNLINVLSIDSQGDSKEINYSYDLAHRLADTSVIYTNNDFHEKSELHNFSPSTTQISGYEKGLRSISPENEKSRIQRQDKPSNHFHKTASIGQTISDVFNTVNDFINENLSLEHNFKEKIENAAVAVFGKNFLTFLGFYEPEQEVGTFGKGEMNSKVRITLINGIINARHDLQDTLEMVSAFHGGNNIHYIFRPTEGWTKDVVKAGLVKCGWISPQAKQLAARWRELIAEMGGVSGGGLIIHYAHSIGAVDTLSAKHLLKPEELNMIQVHTFGSPSILRPGGFQSVNNYVSRGDGVSLLDPVEYIKSLINAPDHVTFVSSSWWIPLIDHQLTFPAYRAILESLGKDFLELYAIP